MKLIRKDSLLKFLALLACAGVFLGCSGKKDKPTYLSIPTNTVTLSSFQNKTDPSWLLDSNGNLLTNSTSIALGGYCAQGPIKVIVLIDGVDAGNSPSCEVADRYWTFTGSIPSTEGTHTLLIYGQGKDGTNYTSAQVSKNIMLDTTPPVIAAVTFPATSPYTTYNASITVSVSVTGGLHSVTASDSTGHFTVNESAGTFDFQTTMNDGESRTISFTAYDLAGNASSSSSVVIQYPGVFNSLIGPLSEYREPSLGQDVPMTNSGYVLSNSAMTNLGAANTYTSTDTLFILETGLGASSLTQ